MISPEQWDEIQDIFDQGLSRTSPEREDLIRARGIGPEIEQQVRELWAHAEPPASFLRSPARLELSFAARLKPGERVGNRFTIADFIGAGGMSEVYLARDERLQRLVALKFLPEPLSSDANYRRRLELEAHAVSSLSHPRICTLHDFGSDEGRLYLVLEYVGGETLESRLLRGPLTEAEAVEIAIQIAEGIGYAHRSNLIHRDLKPSNIMLGTNGVKLLDFGIAKRAAADPEGAGPHVPGEADLTSAGQIAGTPAYMSPEQADGKPLDARTDIYSLGMVLRRMITGAHAGDGVADSNRSSSAPMRRIVERCLATSPEERYATAFELETALREVQALATPVKRAGRRHTPIALVGALMIAAAAIALSRRGGSETPDPLVTPLTAYPGIEYSPTLSPDGKSVAFLWDGGGSENIDVYVQPIGGIAARRLTTDPAEEKWPQWSPDGRWIAFVRNDEILRIAPEGGEETPVTRSASRFEAECGQTFAWAADSRHLLFNRTKPRDGPSPLLAIDIGTGAVRPISAPPSDSIGDWCPVVSFDGKRVFYLHRTPPSRRLRRVASLGADLSLTDVRDVPWIDGNSFAWMPDGTDLVLAKTTQTGSFLFRAGVDRESPPRQLPFGEEGSYVATSRTGDRLVYMRRKLDVDIVSASLAKSGNAGQASRILVSSRTDTGAELSPDGSRIAFISQRGGTAALWVARADGTDPNRLIPVTRVSDVPRWSPDGGRIVVVTTEGIKAVDPNTGRFEIVVSAKEQFETPSYSRDGRWIYYVSNRDGSPQVWRCPANGGESRRMTTSGGGNPIESFDGRELFFAQQLKGESELFVMPTSGGSPQRIAPLRTASSADFCSTDRGLYFFARMRQDDHSTLCMFDTKTRKVKTVAELPVKQRYTAHGLSVSADHRRVLYSVYDLQADLMMVDNFR